MRAKRIRDLCSAKAQITGFGTVCSTGFEAQFGTGGVALNISTKAPLFVDNSA